MTELFNSSSISIEEDLASQIYENSTNRIIQDIIRQVREAITAILIAESLDGEELKARIIEIVSRLKPNVSQAPVITAVLEGLNLGITQSGLDDVIPTPTNKLAKAITKELFSYNKIIKATAKDALRLAKKLPVEDGYVDTVLAAVKAVENKANRFSAAVANRAQAEGTILAAKAKGTKLVWVNELKACLHCLAYAGRVVSPDEPFGTHTYATKPLDINALKLENPDGVTGPPLHPHCRCRLRVWDGPDPRNPEDIPDRNNNVTFPEALQREARRAVLRGDSNYDSLPTKLKAADKLLTIGANLPKTVEKRAARAVANKQFPSRG